MVKFANTEFGTNSQKEVGLPIFWRYLKFLTLP